MAEDESTTKSFATRFVDSVSGLFQRKKDEKAEVNKGRDFLFEDRVALIADLLALKHNHAASPVVWAAQVRSRFLEEPAFRPLAKGLGGTDQVEGGETPPRLNPRDLELVAGSKEPQESEKQIPSPPPDSEAITEVIDAAIRLAERHPVSAFGRDVKTLISREVDTAMDDSTAVRMIRWGHRF